MSKSKILIMAAGTGGHIIPALAVAKFLMAHDVTVRWLGTPQGLEQQLVPPTRIPLDTIAMRGVRRKGIASLLAMPMRLCRAVMQALRVLRAFRPDVVIGFGGFVTVPGGIATWLLRKPLLIHEQNAVAGLSNRCLALLARQVFQAFPDTFTHRYHAITCGNPLREEIIRLPNPQQRYAQRFGPLRLLVIGGSQGAKLFTELVPATVARLTTPLEVWHSAGQRLFTDTEAAYQRHNISARVAPFIDDMASAYAWADLIICRAGALTVSELAAVGLAAVLIPYAFAVDDHQTHNAQWLARSGGALILSEREATIDNLATLLTNIMQRETLLDMAIATRQLSQTTATTVIGDKALALLAAKS